MKHYHGEPGKPATLQQGQMLPWAQDSVPPVDGIYIAMVEQNGALWPYWAARFQGAWVNCYDYEVPCDYNIHFWIGPWSSLKFNS